MNSLYVLRTASRGAAAGSGRSATATALPAFLPADFFAGAGVFAGASVRFLVGKVGLQPVPAALAAVTGLLVAAERRRRVELVERVGPDDAGPELVGDGEDA